MTTRFDISTLERAYSGIDVLPQMNAWQYLTHCKERHPALYERINPARFDVEHVARTYGSMAELSTHFESKLENGRGDSYRQAQNARFLTRSVGFLGIFDDAMGPRRREGAGMFVLDALGGNGTLTRIVRGSRPTEEVPFIVTSDVSGRMIESALGQGLPAIRQPAQDLLWFDDETFDAVIVAYGTHHIPPDQRMVALAEAHRVLKPGGRVVLQDFEIGNPTTRWYDEVLDNYTTTGHRFDYFTKEDFRSMLSDNGFENVEVKKAYDPFVLHAETPEAAWTDLFAYLYTLFALDGLAPDGDGSHVTHWRRLEQVMRETSTFSPSELPPGIDVREPRVTFENGRHYAELPRVSLVATGSRSAAGGKNGNRR